MFKKPVRGRWQAPVKDDGTRVNEAIRAPEIRVIDPDGGMLGVMTPAAAVAKAREYGLDLVEISPNAEPPVCKIIDYGKYRYIEQKRKNEAKKNQKIVEIKEIKLRPNIDIHDYEVKLRAAKSFIEDGDKVKFTLRFRGREMAHTDVGRRVLERARDELSLIAKVDSMPSLEGRQMTMLMSALPQQGKVGAADKPKTDKPAAAPVLPADIAAKVAPATPAVVEEKTEAATAE